VGVALGFADGPGGGRLGDRHRARRDGELGRRELNAPVAAHRGGARRVVRARHLKQAELLGLVGRQVRQVGGARAGGRGGDRARRRKDDGHAKKRHCLVCFCVWAWCGRCGCVGGWGLPSPRLAPSRPTFSGEALAS
jgi:hypothetical protein